MSIEDKELPEDEHCADCRDSDEPCATRRREIHEGWHESGWFWIRPEECHEKCPGHLAAQTKA